jgi:ATP-dependent protease ClpP protease subunit
MRRTKSKSRSFLKRYSLDDQEALMVEQQEMSEQQALALLMNEDKQGQTGVDADENHVYFYSPVTEKSSLELIRLIRRLDIEMSYLASRIGLAKNPPIHLYIQSPGGDVFSGLNICDAIERCKTDVYTYVEGSAASAATLISSMGKKRFMTKRSFMLVHQPQILWHGKHDEFIDEIENQKNIFSAVKEVYLDKCNISEEELEELLKHELWLPAEKCLELGFIDKII